jgi:hypothetical protein
MRHLYQMINRDRHVIQEAVAVSRLGDYLL